MAKEEMKEALADMDVSEEDTFYNPTTLSRISLFAKIISWLFVVVGLGIFVMTIVNVVQAGIPMSQFSQVLPSLLNTLFIVLIAWFFAVMLQAIAEGIYIAVDIAENTRL